MTLFWNTIWVCDIKVIFSSQIQFDEAYENYTEGTREWVRACNFNLSLFSPHGVDHVWYTIVAILHITIYSHSVNEDNIKINSSIFIVYSQTKQFFKQLKWLLFSFLLCIIPPLSIVLPFHQLIKDLTVFQGLWSVFYLSLSNRTTPRPSPYYSHFVYCPWKCATNKNSLIY